MRRSSMAAVALMLLSGAAVAQVSRTPDGKDVPYANQVPANAAAANGSSAAARADMTGNDAAPSAGDQKTEPATPRR